MNLYLFFVVNNKYFLTLEANAPEIDFNYFFYMDTYFIKGHHIMYFSVFILNATPAS